MNDITLGRPPGPPMKSIRSARTAPDTWWAISVAALAAAVIAGEIAVNLVVAGAASSSQIATLRWSGFAAATLAVVAIGGLGLARGTTVSRPTLLRSIVGIAVALEASRAVRYAIRLTHEIRLRRDEPLTALELGLNLVIALLATIAIAATWWLVPSGARSRTRERPSASSR